jgi:hypothetical protein
MAIRPVYLTTWFKAEAPRGGFPLSFGILTAYDPMGIKTPPAENRAADARLKKVLTAARLKPFRVTGRSLSGDHQEPGYGVSAPFDKVRELSAAFRQEAFFWVERGMVWVHKTDGLERLPLAPFTARLLP